MKFDIIIPHLDFQSPESPNIVKLLIDKNNYIKYMSRAIIPYPFLKKPKFYKKHLSIISFKSESLQRYASLKQSKLEKLPQRNDYKIYISSLLKACGYKDINATYKCSFYKPLISENLIR